VSTTARKLAGVIGAVIVLGVLIGLYISSWAVSAPNPVTATPVAGATVPTQA